MSQNRRYQRRFAFQVLYALNFSTDPDRNVLKTSFDNFWTEEKFEVSPTDSFAWSLVVGVFDHYQNLDTVIGEHSKHWKLSRIAKVELTILRLSLYELLFCPDTPLKVVINEAIELAKDFGDDNSKVFINGILDAAAKTNRPQKEQD